MISIAAIATTVVTLIAPFTPYLLEVSKAAGQKWAETVAEKGGEATWNKSKAVWEKIQSRFGKDASVKGATLMLSANPDNESYQTMLAKVLGEHLQQDPQFAQELLQLVGGEESVQVVLANRSSWVEAVTQELEGSGAQAVKASDHSVIKGVIQRKKVW
jgi:hypothetical protein